MVERIPKGKSGNGPRVLALLAICLGIAWVLRWGPSSSVPVDTAPAAAPIVPEDTPRVLVEETVAEVANRQMIPVPELVVPTVELKQEGKDWRIVGTVRTESGVGVSEATVKVSSYWDPSWKTVTDAAGNYELRTDRLQTMREAKALVVEHPEYLRQRKETDLPLDLLSHRTVRRDVVLQAGTRVPFQVVDPHEQPVEGVRVTLKVIGEGLDSRPYISVEQWQTTDQRVERDGHIRLFGGISDAAGKLQIFATEERLRLNAWKPGLIWHSNGIQDLAVRPGMDEVRIVVDPGSSFHGRVVDPSGVPVPDARVFVWRSELRSAVKVKAQMSTATADRAGNFQLAGLLNDAHRYEVLLLHPEFASTHYRRFELFDGMSLTIREGRTIELKLLDSATDAIIEIEPKISLWDERLFAQRSSASRVPSMGMQGWTKETEHGIVRLRHVPEFTEAITVTCEGYDPATVVLAEFESTREDPIVVRLDPTWEIEFLVSDSSSGRSIPGATLEVFGVWEVDGRHRGTWQGGGPEVRVVDGEERIYVKSQWIQPQWQIHCRAFHPDYAPSPGTLVKPAGAVSPRSFVIQLTPKD